MIGKEISHYKILAELGRGGMGVVYKAEDTKLKREVAIKFLPRQIATSDEERERFKIEAQAAAALNHPNIATIHAIEEHDGEMFIVMEYIEGRELKDIIGAANSQHLPVETILDYATQIAAGLQAAHEKGIVHRDIKSSNIMVTENGQVKIMDFGLAKIGAGAQLTKEHSTLGTVAYMSPEQASGEPVDHRTDIWSFGVVLYEMLTGRLPFQGEYEQVVIYSILNEQPAPVPELRAEVPAALQRMIASALQKNPAERFQSFSEISDLLKTPEPERAGRIISERKPPFRIAAALLLVVIGAWVVSEFVLPKKEPGFSQPKHSIAVLPFSVLGSEQFAYLSEGMVNLLGTSLDGAGDLRSVNAHALLGFVAGDRSAAFDVQRAQSVAKHFNAAHYIVGDIIEIGGHLKISASLFEVNESRQPVGTESVEGEVGDLFELVDQLATRLVAELVEGVGTRRTQLAAMTASSLKAVKAYLEGEQAYRAGLYPAAIEAFQRAVAEDSMFALAFYRLSMAQERLAWAEDSRISAELAYRHSQRLSEHDRQFLEAVVALRRGAANEAERLFRNIVRAYPDDAEAWYQLGELMFHGSPLRGGSMSTAREPLSQALFYDPSDLGALYHLIRIAAKDRNLARLDLLTNRFVELSPTGPRTLELRALQAYIVDDTLGAKSIVAELRKSSDTFLPLAVWSVATFAHHIDGAVEIARLMTESDRQQDVQARGHLLLAYLELARGRKNAAVRELEHALRLGDPGAQEAIAWFTSLPFMPVTREEIEQVRTDLKATKSLTAKQAARPSAFYSAHNGVHPPIRLYLLGLLSIRLGQFNEALELADELEHDEGTAARMALAHQLAQGLRAHLKIAQHRRQEGLSLLEDLEIEGWYELTFVSPFYSSASERFAHAEILYSNNRLQEALGWYVGLGENTVAELVFYGPALLRRASIHQLLGETEKARELRAQFRALWSGADPELRVLMEENYLVSDLRN